MARTLKKSDTPQYNAPDFLAWHVIDKGYTLQLETVPINGRIVLRQPLEGPDHQNEKENGRA